MEEIPEVLLKGMATGADWTGNLAVGTEFDWQYKAISNPDFKNMGVPRGRVAGGTSSINGQVFLRAIPEDFENWSSNGVEDWSFADCLKYYLKQERPNSWKKKPNEWLDTNNLNDVMKRYEMKHKDFKFFENIHILFFNNHNIINRNCICLLYTSDAADE